MESKQKIKNYHIIILSLFLSSLLILNSKEVNKKREQTKINEDKNKLFEKIISKRNLDGSTGEKTGTEKVCEKGSKELKEYYKTGQMSEIGLKENEGIKCDDKDSKYMKALKLIIKKLMGEDDEEEEEESGGRLRRLGFSLDEETKSAAIDYLMHFLPILIFLVIGIIAIPAWPICCFCCCCKCCCCCCCNKNLKCQIPCLIFTYIFYSLVVGVCIYGISTTNKVFVDISDTECSFLKFFDEVIEGEKNKVTKPKWAGLEGIQTLLQNLKTTFTNLKTESSGTLQTKIRTHLDSNNPNRTNFINALKNAPGYLLDTSDSSKYRNIYTYTSDDKDYILDIIKKFGKYNIDNEIGEPQLSIMYNWTTEFKVISEEADHTLEISKDDLYEVLENGFSSVIDALEKGDEKIGEFSGKFEDYQEGITNKIIDYSDDIDKYGKLGSKVIFGVLGLINIMIGVFVLLFFICSRKKCTKCCCCRCLCKLFIHLFWNILYLLMILTFLIGFLFAFIGQIGSDAMNVISFIISEDNLGTNGENFIVNKQPTIKNYINICINLNGNIKEELGIDGDISQPLDRIHQAERDIDGYIEQFRNALQMYTYNNAKDKFTDIITDLISNEKFGFIEESSNIILTQPQLQFQVLLNDINSEDTGGYQPWSGGCPSTGCSTPNSCNNPKTCPLSGKVSSSLEQKAKIIDSIWNGLNYANTETIENGGYLAILENLKTLYEVFLNGYIDILEYVQEIIHTITVIINEYVGEDEGFFDIVNCKFIGKNLKVLLKNLNSAIGGDVKTVGICLSVVGCSLALSISSTILFIVILNYYIDKNKELEKQGEIPEYPADSAGKIVAYKNV